MIFAKFDFFDKEECFAPYRELKKYRNTHAQRYDWHAEINIRICKNMEMPRAEIPEKASRFFGDADRNRKNDGSRPQLVRHEQNLLN